MRSAPVLTTSRMPLACLTLCIAFTACDKPKARVGADSRSSAGKKTTLYISTKSGVDMVEIPAGEFVMGSDIGSDDEKPVRTVTISAFMIDRNEVTQESFQSMMGKNPAKSVNPAQPVERVTWTWAVQYCNMRSLREGLQPCYDPKTLLCDRTKNGYRLPTEAEWEYACRAGSKSDFAFGDDPQKLARSAWFKDNAENRPHPAGQKDANNWGLFDMHGNVAEWCEDYYAESYDPAATTDPAGPPSGEERVLRGGSWKSTADACRSSARFSQPPGLADVCFGYDAYGFRCVRSVLSNVGPKNTDSQTPGKP